MTAALEIGTSCAEMLFMRQTARQGEARRKARTTQEGIPDLHYVTRGQDPITERALRNVAAQVDWRTQNIAWVPLRQRLESPPAA
jgi:hypothetical protein